MKSAVVDALKVDASKVNVDFGSKTCTVEGDELTDEQMTAVAAALEATKFSVAQ